MSDFNPLRPDVRYNYLWTSISLLVFTAQRFHLAMLCSMLFSVYR